MDLANLLPLLILLALTALSGGISAVIVLLAIARRMAVTKVELDQPRIEHLVMNVELKDSDDAPVARWVVNVSGAEITAGLVEQWLNKRDLVMSPKGKDFKPAATAANEA